MNSKVNLITLGVMDVERSATFFENVMGWERSPASHPGMVIFAPGGVAVSLYPASELAADAGLECCELPGFRGLTLSHNTRSEKEVDEMLERAEKSGGTIVKPAQKVFWGGYHGYFSTPDGHLFEVAYNPFWEFDSHGNLKL